MFFFLPLGTTRPCWRRPYYLYGLMAVMAAVFVVQAGYPEVLPPGFVPGQPTLAGFIASAFMHAGILHLAGNMLFLWLFGTLTEDVFGPKLMLGVYGASHAGALAVHTAVARAFSGADLQVPCVGASGAVAGIMGLAAVCFLRTKVRVWYVVGYCFRWRADVEEIGAPFFVALWAGWELFQGILATGSHVRTEAAHWAHIGGLAVGLSCAFALRLRERVVCQDLVGGREPASTPAEGLAQAAQLERMVARSPENADAWYSLGRAREIAGHPDQALEAYERALRLYLKGRHLEGVARAYEALRGQDVLGSLPEPLLFPLAAALERGGRAGEAFEVLRHLAAAHAESPDADTALAHAAEIAQETLGDVDRAAQCWQALLQDYPFSRWRSRALMRMKELRAAPAPGAEPTHEARGGEAETARPPGVRGEPGQEAPPTGATGTEAAGSDGAAQGSPGSRFDYLERGRGRPEGSS